MNHHQSYAITVRDHIIWNEQRQMSNECQSLRRELSRLSNAYSSLIADNNALVNENKLLKADIHYLKMKDVKKKEEEAKRSKL